MRFSSSLMTIERRSAPIMILSFARSNSSIETRRLIGPRGEQRSFVHQVRKVGAGESGCAARNDRRPDVIGERHASHVNA